MESSPPMNINPPATKSVSLIISINKENDYKKFS